MVDWLTALREVEDVILGHDFLLRPVECAIGVSFAAKPPFPVDELSLPSPRGKHLNRIFGGVVVPDDLQRGTYLYGRPCLVGDNRDSTGGQEKRGVSTICTTPGIFFASLGS